MLCRNRAERVLVGELHGRLVRERAQVLVELGERVQMIAHSRSTSARHRFTCRRNVRSAMPVCLATAI
jgi:hypothetical protein